MAVGDSGGHTSGDAERGEFSVHRWAARGMVGGYGHANASNRTGRARMEWYSQREVRVWGRNE